MTSCQTEGRGYAGRGHSAWQAGSERARAALLFLSHPQCALQAKGASLPAFLSLNLRQDAGRGWGWGKPKRCRRGVARVKYTQSAGSVRERAAKRKKMNEMKAKIYIYMLAIYVLSFYFSLFIFIFAAASCLSMMITRYAIRHAIHGDTRHAAAARHTRYECACAPRRHALLSCAMRAVPPPPRAKMSPR